MQNFSVRETQHTISQAANYDEVHYYDKAFYTLARLNKG
jgi:hypothetical protein